MFWLFTVCTCPFNCWWLYRVRTGARQQGTLVSTCFSHHHLVCNINVFIWSWMVNFILHISYCLFASSCPKYWIFYLSYYWPIHLLSLLVKSLSKNYVITSITCTLLHNFYVNMYRHCGRQLQKYSIKIYQ